MKPTNLPRQLKAVLITGLVVLGAYLAWELTVSRTATGSHLGEDHPGPVAEVRSAGPTPMARVSMEVEVSGPTNALPEPLEALLETAGHRIRMGDVPQLDPETEAELLRRYDAAEGIGARYPLLRLMVFGGSRKAAPLIARALTNDYAGHPLSGGDVSVLVYLPRLMGVAAAADDEALRWLLKGVEPGFWERIRLWTEIESNDAPQRPEVMRESCLTGLAVCGRESAHRFLDGLRQNPARVMALDIDGGMVDAAFIRDMVAEHGIQGAMDGCLSSAARFMEAFRAWKHTTTNGMEWGRWRANAQKFKPGRTSQ